MTEAEWLTSSDCSALLQYAWDKVSDRKLRLFACACCRRVKSLLPADRGSLVVRMAERFADGLANLDELEGTWQGERPLLASKFGTTAAVYGTLWAVSWSTAWAAADGASRESANAQFSGQADLLREIVGNPFRQTAVPLEWPVTVVRLAEALYQGADCDFALHDALLEAGCVELAEHFSGIEHPRGCWALDLVLAKH